MNILVTGASGFVGRHLSQQLCQQGHRVLALSRQGSMPAELCQHSPGSIEALRGDVVSGEGLAEAMQHAQAVVHLVGIIEERGSEVTFEKVHVEGTRNVVSAAREADIERFVQMSALGVREDSESRYLSSKARAEALVQESQLAWTIFRPSLIFGLGDDFFGRVLKNLVSAAPIVPQIGDGHFPFRPVWVGDVTAAFSQALFEAASIGQSYDLVGPQEYSFRELLELMQRALKQNKPIIPVPLSLMKLAVPMMQILPKPPITRDQFLMLLEGSTADPSKAQQAFALPMRTLPETLPDILAHSYQKS